MKKLQLLSILLLTFGFLFTYCNDGDYYDLDEVIEGGGNDDNQFNGSFTFNNKTYDIARADFVELTKILTATGPSTASPNGSVVFGGLTTLSVGEWELGTGTVVNIIADPNDPNSVEQFPATTGTINVQEVTQTSIKFTFTVTTESGTATGSYDGVLNRI